MLLGFSPKFGALIHTIPGPVIGGTLPLLGSGYRVGHGDTIILESCVDNPPEGMTSKDIRNMSEDELLDMDFFLKEVLTSAMTALRYKADKSVLEEIIGKAKAMDLTGYSAENVALFNAHPPAPPGPPPEYPLS